MTPDVRVALVQRAIDHANDPDDGGLCRILRNAGDRLAVRAADRIEVLIEQRDMARQFSGRLVAIAGDLRRKWADAEKRAEVRP